MKRFWTNATVDEQPHGLAILLDGKPLRIPGRATTQPAAPGSPLLLQTQALAQAVADEWQAAANAPGETFAMDQLPLTRLAATAQDRIAPDTAAIARELARYAETDLLCYRAHHPEPLVLRQALMWQPWLDWLAQRHQAHLKPTQGIVHLPQDPAALTQIQSALAAQSPDTLAALGIAIPLLGSAVLGLALAEGAMDAIEAHALAALDEMFEVETWGDDPEAAQRRTTVATDIALAERYLRLATPP